MLDIIQKAPADRLDYDIDLAMWLVPGDSVNSATAQIEGATVSVDETDITTDRVKLWLQGGAAGEAGTLTVLVTTTGGRVKELCYRIRVRDC